MSRTVKGLTLALVMLFGALTLTGFLANSLKQRAQQGRSPAQTYSPSDGATVDEWGWPVEPKRDSSADDAAPTRGRSRSRLFSPGSADQGA